MTGDELLLMRRAAGLTQGELAKAIGYSRQAVVKWERGIHDIPSKIQPAIIAACATPKEPKPDKGASKLARATFEAYAQMRNRDHFTHACIMDVWAKAKFVPNAEAVALIVEAFPELRASQ